MSKYPKISDENFYNKINKVYANYRITKSKKKMEDICFPKKYELQLPQQFVSEFINPKTPYKGLLVYHRIGAGKTCSAIRIGEQWKAHRKIIVVVPASLKGNFRAELRSLCADENYLTNKERKLLATLSPSSKEYKQIIAESDKRIDKVYSIYSYNKFVELVQNKEIKFSNTLLMIDEIQNMVSEEGTFYTTLYDAIHSAPSDLRIVLLSATPMFDKPNEIALTMNLLRIPNELPTGKAFYDSFVQINKNSEATKYTYTPKNLDKFKQALKGYVSYFRGAPPYVFPRMVVRYVKCPMSEFQYQAYLDVLKAEEKLYNQRIKQHEIKTVKNLPNNFFIGTRIVSNVVFPNRKINEEGFKSFKGKNLLDNMDKYSVKFDKIIRRIEGARGKVFAYSSFKEYGGIKSLARALEEFGYLNYTTHGPGPRRYAIWSGDEDIAMKEEIRAVYNRINNLEGRKLKILLGSPSIKEGVSLTAVRQVHILEPYWNQARLDQVIGRASRYCSHKDVEEEKRLVRVYVYIATKPEDVEGDETVDEYIHNLSNEKNKLVREFERAIKEAAVDCELNLNANVYADESDIICEN